VSGIVVVDRRIAEVQFQPVAEMRVLRTTGQLLERIFLQWVDAAEAPEAIRVAGYLLTGPVVFRLHALILVLEFSIGAALEVCNGQYRGPSNARCVQQSNKVIGRDRFDRHHFDAGGAEQMLMMVGERRRLAVRGRRAEHHEEHGQD
jgi:hypothetical protein